MSDRSLFGPEAASRFFSSRMKRLNNSGFPRKHHRWFVRHVEAFIKAHSGRRIKQLTCRDIEAYPETPGRQERLTGWQFRQHIDAIRILYCQHLHADVATTLDWQHWIDSSRRLDADHPTTARSLCP